MRLHTPKELHSTVEFLYGQDTTKKHRMTTFLPIQEK